MIGSIVALYIFNAVEVLIYRLNFLNVHNLTDIWLSRLSYYGIPVSLLSSMVPRYLYFVTRSISCVPILSVISL